MAETVEGEIARNGEKKRLGRRDLALLTGAATGAASSTVRAWAAIGAGVQFPAEEVAVAVKAPGDARHHAYRRSGSGL